MPTASDWLPDDLRLKQRRCVQRHNGYVVGVLVLVMTTLVTWLPHLHRGDSFGWMVGAVVTEAIGGIIAVVLLDRRFCRAIGFVCPHCGKPLYWPGDVGRRNPLVTRGVCPHCQRFVVPAEPERT